jgi:hypothetical protein
MMILQVLHPSHSSPGGNPMALMVGLENTLSKVSGGELWVLRIVGFWGGFGTYGNAQVCRFLDSIGVFTVTDYA